MKTNKFWSMFMMLILLFSVSVSFTSCHDDDDDDDPYLPPVAESPIVGRWVERFYVESTKTYQISTWYFGSDGKGQFVYREENERGQGANLDPEIFSYIYKENDGTIRINFDGDATLYSGTAEITGNTLILRINGTYYTCTKQ